MIVTAEVVTVKVNNIFNKILEEGVRYEAVAQAVVSGQDGPNGV